MSESKARSHPELGVEQLQAELRRVKYRRRFARSVLCILLVLALLYMPLSHEANLMSCLDGSATISMKEIGKAFTGTEKFQYLLPFEAISILLLACIIGGVTVARKR